MKFRAVLLLLALAAEPALGGMPSFTLSDAASMRLSGISFFLVVLFAVAWGVKLLWNFLRQDFPRIPRLSYGRALAAVVLLGLLFNIVLLMIAGTRELMTPGAWEKSGLSYKLKNEARSGSQATPEARR